MNLPETERELREHALAACEDINARLKARSAGRQMEPDHWLIGVAVARTAIRAYCPHLRDSDNLDLSEEPRP